jgi:hypothetical protein
MSYPSVLTVGESGDACTKLKARRNTSGRAQKKRPILAAALLPSEERGFGILTTTPISQARPQAVVLQTEAKDPKSNNATKQSRDTLRSEDALPTRGLALVRRASWYGTQDLQVSFRTPGSVKYRGQFVRIDLLPTRRFS